MRAISLHQPWATGVALGLKKNETRHWPTPYRGRLAIHAAKLSTGYVRPAFDFLLADVNIAVAFAAAGYTDFEDMPLGAIVATCELVDCVSTNDIVVSPMEYVWGNYGPNRFAWHLANVVALPVPVPCKGRQGFFEWDERLAA